MPGVDDQDHVAAVAAIAAVGAAARDVRLAPKGGGAVAAGTGGHEDPHLVSEHRQPIIPTARRTAPRRDGRATHRVPTGSAAG